MNLIKGHKMTEIPIHAIEAKVKACLY